MHPSAKDEIRRLIESLWKRKLGEQWDEGWSPALDRHDLNSAVIIETLRRMWEEGSKLPSFEDLRREAAKHRASRDTDVCGVCDGVPPTFGIRLVFDRPAAPGVRLWARGERQDAYAVPAVADESLRRSSGLYSFAAACPKCDRPDGSPSAEKIDDAWSGFLAWPPDALGERLEARWRRIVSRQWPTPYETDPIRIGPSRDEEGGGRE